MLHDVSRMVVSRLAKTIAAHGIHFPLTDIGMSFAARLVGRKGGRNSDSRQNCAASVACLADRKPLPTPFGI